MMDRFRAVLNTFKYQVTLVNMMISLASDPSLNSSLSEKSENALVWCTCTTFKYENYFKITVLYMLNFFFTNLNLPMVTRLHMRVWWTRLISIRHVEWDCFALFHTQ